MLKNLVNFSKLFIITGYFILMIILPVAVFRLGHDAEIFPGLELMIVYYLITYKTIKNWHLFLIGLLLDQLYNMPPGTNSLSLILAWYLLMLASRWCFLKDYTTNLSIFALYSLFIILLRYLIILMMGDYYIEGTSIYFYYLTTIFAYPVFRIIIEKPMKILKIHA